MTKNIPYTHRRPVVETEVKETPRELAIGTDDGFQPDKPKYELDTSSTIVLMPNFQVMKTLFRMCGGYLYIACMRVTVISFRFCYVLVYHT